MLWEMCKGPLTRDGRDGRERCPSVFQTKLTSKYGSLVELYAGGLR